MVMNMKKIKLLFEAVLIFSVCLSSGCGEIRETEGKKEPVKIVFASYRDNTGALKALTEEFMSLNENINVKLMALSNHSSENYRILSSVLSGNEVSVDIMAVEDVWLKGFIEQGYIKPVMKSVKWDAAEYPKRFSDLTEKDGECYGIPFELDMGTMFYRRELTDGSLDLKQLSGQSEIKYFIGETDGEDKVCTAMECIRLAGNFEDGLKLYKAFAGNSAFKEKNSVREFSDKSIAYMRCWNSLSGQLHAEMDKDWKSIRTAVMESGGKSYATARVYCLAINAALEKEKEAAAAEFLNFMLEEKNQLEFNKNSGTVPLKYKYYKNPIALDYSEQNEKIGNYLNNLNYRNMLSDYMQRSKEAQEALENFVEGGDINEAKGKIKVLMN